MKKIFALLTLATLVSFVGHAQLKNGKVSGTVVDGSHKTIESATIALLRAKDSSTVKFTVADRAGEFLFENIKEGSYLVSVTAVGHQKGFSEKVQLTDTHPEVSIKTIELIPQAKAMSGVVVTAKKPLIEQRIDRTIVNVEAAATNVGASALEVLEKSPGISVDKDGNISLKGKQGVMVLVDGRPTQLSGTDLANLLRNMNASQLDQVEIMTNPPAKYDAAGNAGVINIKTKKTRQIGYNGSINLGYGQGRFPKFNEGLNFNYRQGKFNLFTNLSHNYNRRYSDLDIQRKFRDKNSKELISYFDQEARMSSENNFYNGKIGLDYFAGKKTTLGVVVTGFSAPGTFENRNLNDIYDVFGQLNRQTKALSVQKEDWKNFSTNLNFRQLIDSTGKELTADLDYITYDGRQRQTLSNMYYDATGKELQKADTLYGNLPQLIHIYSGKADYLQPLKKSARFEAGIKSSYVKTDNNAMYDTVHNGSVMRDLNRSNYFIYEEFINAAYVNLSGPLSKKWNGQLGLRLENTTAKGKQMTTGQVFDRSYIQLFPTAYLQYKPSDKNSYVLNYGRRIRRPNYESLNPFIEYLDRYTSQQGNPELKPQFSHNIELSHTYKGFLTTTLNYSKTTDIIQQVIEQNEATNETYIKQANIANQQQYGISVSVGMPVTKWWTSNVYINGFANRFEGIVNKEPITLTSSTIMLNGSQQLKINKNFSAELSGWYRTAAIEGVIKTKPVGALSVGLSQQVMKGNGTLRLNVRDILYSQKFRAESRYGTVDAAFQQSGDSRVANLGFTWRFNKGKLNGGQKRRAGSANDEQNRVSVGSGN